MDLATIVFLILIPIGIATGIFGALTGLGGGVLMVPILSLGIFLFSEPYLNTVSYATTISSTVILFIAISGTIAFGIQRKIDYIVGLLSAPFAMLGSYLGKLSQTKIIETANGEAVVLILFVILLLVTSARMIYKIIISKRKAKKALENNQKNELSNTEFIVNEVENKPSRYKLFLDKLTLDRVIVDNSNKTWEYSAKLYLVPINVLGGFVASMVGVGGGIVVVPVLNLLVGLPIHFATATSVFIMIFTKTITITTAYVGSSETTGIWWPYVAGLAIGIVIGAQLGALFAKKIKADPLKLIFAMVIALVAIWSIIDWRLQLTS
ncbi:MAG: sulfite exporter TauE/SafE family protein [Candidatus Heimdallarchaeota archaeon]|nr:sulfite exporter TauE/SafE family protein [Candidatus Heimdallarchaeota archaeon]